MIRNQTISSLPTKILAACSVFCTVGFLNQRNSIKKEIVSNRKILLGSLPIVVYSVKSIFKKLTQKKLLIRLLL